jgi:hypothetical protein
MGESGHTAASVPAHLDLSSIGIVVAPSKIGLLRGLHQDQSVGPYGDPSAANPCHELPYIHPFDNSLPIVNDDKVVSTPAHFGKGDFWG